MIEYLACAVRGLHNYINAVTPEKGIKYRIGE